MPSESVTASLGRCTGRPRTRAKLGALTPDARAAAAATGDISATAAQASERSQSPGGRLSSGTFATVQPVRPPATIAIALRPNPQRARAPRAASPAEHTLVRKGGGQPLANGIDVLGRMPCRNRKALPVGQDVDRHDIDGGGDVAMA